MASTYPRRFANSLCPRLLRIGSVDCRCVSGFLADRIQSSLVVTRCCTTRPGARPDCALLVVVANSMQTSRRRNRFPSTHLVGRRSLSSSSKPVDERPDVPSERKSKSQESSSSSWSMRFQTWTAVAAATSAARGVGRTAQRVSATAVEASKSAVTRISTSIAQTSRNTAQRLTDTARSTRVVSALSSPQRLTSNVRARISHTLERATSGISSRMNSITSSVSAGLRATLVEPFQQNAKRFGLWFLVAIAVYGVASTVPREITLHYLQQQQQQQEQQQKQQQQQQQRAGKDETKNG
jgi:hypothetical protein